MPHLVVENGSQRGERIELQPGTPIVVGRDQEAAITLDDHLCSRRHFEVRAKDGGAEVEDLGSSNGTFVNDARISEPKPLQHGDTLRAGETQFTFLVDEGSQSRGLVGKTIGGYRILERIGRGGMGTVYRALQVSLNRVVAFKILSPRVAADPAFVVKFQKEAQAAGRLNHANIVQVYDVGSDKDLHFYSMEYIENGSVQDLATREGTLDVGLALDIMLDAARGLEYAEKRGLVHRDIKPDNLMINAEGVVKIADLGLARDGGHAARESGVSHSDDEGIFGTPHFIAPEQALGKTVDTRSDIYSLGASFYRLLAGETPFRGDSVREIIQAQIHEDPVPLREKRREVPANVAALVERMMRKDMEERPASAAELVTELERLQAQLEGGGKRRLLIAAAVVLVAGGGAAFALFGNNTGPAPKPDDGGSAKPIAGPSEAELERQRLQRLGTEAREALTAARLKELDAPPSTVDDLKAWIARYKEIQERFSEVPDATADAGAWITALEGKVTAKEDAAAEEAAALQAKKEAAERAVQGALDTVKPMVEEERYGAAILALELARSQPALRDRPEAKTLADKRGTLEGAATAATESALARGQAEEGAGHFDEAVTIYQQMATRLRVEGAADDPALATLFGLVERLDQAVDKARAAKRAKLVADHEADQTLFLSKQKAALATMRKGFAPTQAKLGLEEAIGTLRTPFFRARATATLEALKGSERLLQAFLERAKIEGFDPPKIDLPSTSGANREVSWTLTEADAEGFTVKRGRNFEDRWTYDRFSAAELWKRLLAERIPDDEDLRRAAVEMLLLSGSGSEALPLAEGLGDDALLERIRKEIAASDRLRTIRELEAQKEADPMVALKLVPLIDRFLNEARGTYAFSLATDGTTRLWQLDEAGANTQK